ncbi:MAG: hypothetical protein F6K40_26165 [Okeania sp. SIO3I5]|uniref:hypothetical protein n=1 Tax=Okeania sp. SIO3I5 TaxID=2607805 RepID=UPI0013B6C3E0|nr:hypothetical protein [Okeania sp. SIO3I5]NEQ39550.1 hypothetical protein [Okeania sp. SIO3I5]
MINVHALCFECYKSQKATAINQELKAFFRLISRFSCRARKRKVNESRSIPQGNQRDVVGYFISTLWTNIVEFLKSTIYRVDVK